MKKTKFFAYFIPSAGVSGIAVSWKECQKEVSGKSNVRYRAFPARKEAEEWLKAGAEYGLKKEYEPGIYFDAGTGRGRGVEVSVTDGKGGNLLKEILTGKKLNKFGKYVLGPSATNNYGELLALDLALKISARRKNKKIFGDSRLVINYWSKGFAKKDHISAKTLELINEVSDLRRKFEKRGGKIKYVSGSENPADLGFHR